MATEAEVLLAAISTMPRLCNQEDASILARCSFNSNRALTADQSISSVARACSLKARHGSIRANDAALNAVHGISNWGTTLHMFGAGEDTSRPQFYRGDAIASDAQDKSPHAGSQACSYSDVWRSTLT